MVTANLYRLFSEPDSVDHKGIQIGDLGIQSNEIAS